MAQTHNEESAEVGDLNLKTQPTQKQTHQHKISNDTGQEKDT